MKRNQFYNVGGNILKLERATKKKSAFIQIAIPDETCEKFIKSIIDCNLKKEPQIKGLELSWIDKEIKEGESK